MPTSSIGNSRANQQYIREWVRDVKAVVKDFDRKDRVKILRAAARPIVKASRTIAPRGNQPHYRYKRRRGRFEQAARSHLAKNKSSKRKGGRNEGGRKGVDPSKIAAVYYPGNLQKSLRSLVFRRSKDVFVGPKQGGPQRREYGRSVRTADGYYAQMIYGSAAAFRARVLRPALSSGRIAALKKAEEIRTQILKRARQKGVAR